MAGQAVFCFILEQPKTDNVGIQEDIYELMKANCGPHMSPNTRNIGILKSAGLVQ